MTSGPSAFEGQFELSIALIQVVGWKREVLEPRHEVRSEHLSLAIEGVATQPGAFPSAESEGPDVVQLFPDLALVDDFGKTDGFRAVDEAEGHARVGVISEHRLAHEQLVEVRVDQGTDNRVDLPLVVPDAGRDADHGRSPQTGPFAKQLRDLSSMSSGPCRSGRDRVEEVLRHRSIRRTPPLNRDAFRSVRPDQLLAFL